MVLVIGMIGITIVDKYYPRFLYSFLRPKVVSSIYLNMTILTASAWVILLVLLQSLIKNRGATADEVWLAQPIITFLAFFSIYYIWLSFARVSQGALRVFVNQKNVISHFYFEKYLVIVLAIIIAFTIDTYPTLELLSTYQTLLAISVVCLLIVYSNYRVKRNIYNWTWSNNVPYGTDKLERSASPELIYEKNPYHFHRNIESVLENNGTITMYQMKKLKDTLAIEHLPLLNQYLSYNSDDVLLNETHNFLNKIKKEVSSIEMPYEFVESSNDTLLICALTKPIGKAIDKNLLLKLLNDSRIRVKKRAILEAGKHHDINYIPILIEALSDPDYTFYAQLAICNIGEDSLRFLEIEYSKKRNNHFFSEAYFNILAEIGNETAHELLFNALTSPSKATAIRALRRIITYNIAIKNKRISGLDSLFDELIILVLLNNNILSKIDTNEKGFHELFNALIQENTEYIRLIRGILTLLTTEKRINYLFTLYQRNDIESHALANDIIDITFKNSVSHRNKLKLLFNPFDIRLLEVLQEEYPYVDFREQFPEKSDIIWSLLRRDYDKLSTWTRACAISALAFVETDELPIDLTAEFINNNPLIKEIAALTIYKIAPEFYTIFLNRLSKEESLRINYLVETNAADEQNNLSEEALLAFTKVKFLKSLSMLDTFTLNELNIYHPLFKTRVLPEGTTRINIKEESEEGFWILETGSLEFSKNGLDFSKKEKKSIIDGTENSFHQNTTLFFRSEHPTRLFFIEKLNFLNLIYKSGTSLDRFLQNNQEFSSFLTVKTNSLQPVA